MRREDFKKLTVRPVDEKSGEMSQPVFRLRPSGVEVINERKAEVKASQGIREERKPQEVKERQQMRTNDPRFDVLVHQKQATPMYPLKASDMEDKRYWRRLVLLLVVLLMMIGVVFLIYDYRIWELLRASDR